MNRSRLGTREKKVVFSERGAVVSQSPENLVPDYGYLTKAVAISALVEKPQTVKHSSIRKENDDTLANYFSCQI